MKFKISVALWTLIAGIFFIGCIKVPDKLTSPTIKIEPVIKNNKEFYTMRLSAGISNENSDVVLMDVKGAVIFHDPNIEGQRISLPFELSAIFPFETGALEITKVYSETDIMPLLALLGTDKEKIVNNKGMERSLLDDRKVMLEITGYKKVNVLDALKKGPQ